MAIDALGNTALAIPNAAAESRSSATALTDSDPKAAQDKFLKLLVTQLKNQDPLSPMDNAQVTTQIAQLNTVTGIQDLNKSMQAIGQALGSAQVVQSTSLLGKSVLTSGNAITFSGQPVNFGIEFANSADLVSVNILNGLGQTVATRDLGAQRAGLQNAQWDGKDDNGKTLPAGNYTYSVQASSNNQRVNTTPFQLNVVKSLENMGAEGIRITTQSGKTLSLSDVKQVF
jgi:flagellar basal-body rod modification protein FlgD